MNGCGRRHISTFYYFIHTWGNFVPTARATEYSDILVLIPHILDRFIVNSYTYVKGVYYQFHYVILQSLTLYLLCWRKFTIGTGIGFNHFSSFSKHFLFILGQNIGDCFVLTEFFVVVSSFFLYISAL